MWPGEQSDTGPTSPTTVVDACCPDGSVGSCAPAAPPTNNCFKPYTPGSTPADLATTTTSTGMTVPYIVRVERGTDARVLGGQAPLLLLCGALGFLRRELGGDVLPLHRDAEPLALGHRGVEDEVERAAPQRQARRVRALQAVEQAVDQRQVLLPPDAPAPLTLHLQQEHVVGIEVRPDTTAIGRVGAGLVVESAAAARRGAAQLATPEARRAAWLVAVALHVDAGPAGHPSTLIASEWHARLQNCRLRLSASQVCPHCLQVSGY